jgi:hypothetical protein
MSRSSRFITDRAKIWEMRPICSDLAYRATGDYLYTKATMAAAFDSCGRVVYVPIYGRLRNTLEDLKDKAVFSFSAEF